MTARPADVRFYVDADLLGLGKLLSTGVLDADWIPVVAERGWLIITRDSKIIENRAEITAVRENNAKMVALNQRDAQTKWGQLEVFMTQWRRIDALSTEQGPSSGAPLEQP